MLLFIWFYTASNNRQEQISIHLMLLFITNKRIFFQINSHISIHLMLLFICPAWSCPYPHLNFNTSHVTVYLCEWYLWVFPLPISIHLMLLFIAVVNFKRYTPSSFQYISCYCLSDRLFLMVFLPLLFQYISCYCLSCILYSLPFYIHHFNTSHVTVYRKRKSSRQRWFCISIHLMLLFI